MTSEHYNRKHFSNVTRLSNLKKLLYSGIVFLVALSLIGGVFAQSATQVAIANVVVSSARDVILVTVTVDSSSHDDHNANYLITLKTQYLTKNGNWIFVDFQTVVIFRGDHVTHVFRVPFHYSGQYLFTTNVYALPSMQFLGTASVDPPAVGGRD